LRISDISVPCLIVLNTIRSIMEIKSEIENCDDLSYIEKWVSRVLVGKH